MSRVVIFVNGYIPDLDKLRSLIQPGTDFLQPTAALVMSSLLDWCPPS